MQDTELIDLVHKIQSFNCEFQKIEVKTAGKGCLKRFYDDYCAFSHNYMCAKWENFKLTRHELEEADNLCHGNWIGIQRLYNYIDKLKAILDKNDIEYPDI